MSLDEQFAAVNFKSGSSSNVPRLQLLVLGSIVLLSAFRSSLGADKGVFPVDGGQLLGGASKVSAGAAAGGNQVSLAQSGQGVKLTGLPAGSTLAIRYGSVEVGTVSVAVNDQPVRKVNVHFTGDATKSFLNAKIVVAVPAGGTVTISRGEGDVGVTIEQIMVGDGDLGLPPDIWNLPELKVAAGPYPADWKGLAQAYAAPEWWRDAKFGAWAHWDPQSMPVQGDWFARGIYQEGSEQYNYQVQHFGDPSEYGYKDIAHNWVIAFTPPSSPAWRAWRHTSGRTGCGLLRPTTWWPVPRQ